MAVVAAIPYPTQQASCMFGVYMLEHYSCMRLLRLMLLLRSVETQMQCAAQAHQTVVPSVHGFIPCHGLLQAKQRKPDLPGSSAGTTPGRHNL
jgi:hypothetical protein